MKRVVAVLVIGVLTTLALGVDRVSWAGQGEGDGEREARRERVLRRLAGLRRGSTVEIERTDRTKVRAVIQEISRDSISVLVEEAGRERTAGDTSRGVVTQTIPVDDIRNIREITVGRMSRTNKALIYAAVAAGLVALVGVCVAALPEG